MIVLILFQAFRVKLVHKLKTKREIKKLKSIFAKFMTFEIWNFYLGTVKNGKALLLLSHIVYLINKL